MRWFTLLFFTSYLTLMAHAESLPSSAALAAPTPAEKVTRCFHDASRKSDPVSRDEKREVCLRGEMSKMPLDRCLQFARGLEYFTNTEEMRLACVLAQSRLTAAACAKVAVQLDNASNREDVLWECLQRLNLTITSRECHKLAQLMIYPVQQARASSYCASEIAASRR